MAKPKFDVIVRVVDDKIIAVYHKDLLLIANDIQTIEGVTNVVHMTVGDYLFVYTNPLYDINELRDEIKELLHAEIPDVFKGLE